MTEMQFTTQLIEGVRVVEMKGDLDSSSAEFAHEQISAAVRASPEVVVDLSAVHYISSAGLRVMLLVYREARCSGARVAVVGLSADLELLMQATGFLGYFRVAESPAAGIRLLRTGGSW